MGHDDLQEENAGIYMIQEFPELDRRNFINQNVQLRVAKILLISHVKYLPPFLGPAVLA